MRAASHVSLREALTTTALMRVKLYTAGAALAHEALATTALMRVKL